MCLNESKIKRSDLFWFIPVLNVAIIKITKFLWTKLYIWIHHTKMNHKIAFHCSVYGFQILNKYFLNQVNAFISTKHRFFWFRTTICFMDVADIPWCTYTFNRSLEAWLIIYMPFHANIYWSMLLNVWKNERFPSNISPINVSRLFLWYTVLS